MKSRLSISIWRKEIFLFLIILILTYSVYSQPISSESITSITEEFDSELDFIDEIQKIYEISDSSLEKGYSATLNEKDAFRIKIKERDYYIIVWNITDENKANIIFPGKRVLSYEEGSIALVDINQDYKLDIQLELKSIEDSYENAKAVASIELENDTATLKDTEYIPGKKANLFIKNIVEKELVPSGDYFELFDVTVRLVEEEILSARELGAFIVFENFGEGPSGIDIVYSIIDEEGKEVYKGVDSKVVQTEERVVKNFDFLELPLGKYILRTEIFYGQNQTGESEQDFEIVGRSIINLLKVPLLFISTIILIFFGIMYAKKSYKKKKNVKKRKGVKNGV